MTDPELAVHQVLSDDLRDWLTSKLRYPVLAVLAPDGSPIQSVMWFDIDPDRADTIVMNTKMGRAKERYLRNDPRVSICFEDGLEWVALQGTAELEDDREAAMAGIVALADRYGSDGKAYAGQQRVTVRIRVDKVIHHA